MAALRGLLVSDERDPKPRIVTAREGRLLTDEANQRITLSLLDGAVNEVDVVPDRGAGRPTGSPSRAAPPAPRATGTRASTSTT